MTRRGGSRSASHVPRCDGISRKDRHVCREFWGYAVDKALSLEALLSEQYRGIRPAPGYPAQPDHTEKGTLFKLLSAEQRIGMRLTESFAMWPSASVCGLYFSHPDSHYFGIAKIEFDQVEDYASRKGWKRDGRKMARPDPQLRSRLPKDAAITLNVV